METPKKNVINDNGLYQTNIDNIKNKKFNENPSNSSNYKKLVPTSSNTNTKKKIRCAICNKKVGLLGFGCRCGDSQYCSIHRLPESHNCTFNHQSYGRENLSQNMVKVVADKFKDRI